MNFSMAQLRALAILPKVTGGLSFIFSATTAAYVCRSPKKRGKFYHRLILGMSLADMSSSIWLAMSTWPIPGDTRALYASGNEATCRAQGFFTQAGLSSPIYNSSLSFFYLLAIKYAWRDARLFHWEVVFHGVPIVLGLGTAIAALALDILHSANLWCWIGPNPDGSGPDVDVFRMALFYCPLWIAIIVVSVNLFFVFAYVRGITLKSEEHTKRSMGSLTWPRCTPDRSIKEEVYISADDDELYQDQGFIEENPEKEDTNISVVAMQSALESSEDVKSERQKEETVQMLSFAKRRREVAFQCLRFAVAFYITWIPISSVRILQMVEKPVPYGLLLWAAMMTPLQGLPNFFVYLFPLIQNKLRARREHKLELISTGTNVQHPAEDVKNC
jgi:hypothetical protein